MPEMTQRQRIDAVLHRRKADKVPFAPYDEFAPMDDEFISSMVSRGMGRWTFHTRVVNSERPNVRIEKQSENNIDRTFYHTPAGTVSASPLREGMIKSAADYDPVIFLIEDEVFSPYYDEYENEIIRFGESGFVRVQGMSAPYSSAYGYFGMGWDEGFKRYIYHQRDYPDHFAELLKALERRNERLFQIIADCPAEVICIGSVDEHYGPGQYEKSILPFYEKYVPMFHECGKLVYIHAHSSNLSWYADLIPRTGLDMIDAFTTPPIGDLSVAEARKAWGEDTVISVHFPEPIYLRGYEATKEYTLQLLRSDLNGHLIISMTEMGIQLAKPAGLEKEYKDGMLAIMDAIDEYC